MTREETARKLAEALGWSFHPYVPRLATEPSGTFGILHPPAAPIPPRELPAPDAPLPDHLAFVGHVAEALGRDWLLRVDQDRPSRGWQVRFLEWPCGMNSRSCEEEADDLSWAAMLAALAVKGAR